MENKAKNVESGRTFDHSDLTLKDREKLMVSGLEKAYELNETRLLLKASGSNLLITGENLNVTRLDVEAGVIEVEGKVCDIRYSSGEKTNFFKKIFK